MLRSTLAAEIQPGTNRKGTVAGASFVFLLPRLELARVLCIGPPSEAALRTLAARARSVLVACAERDVSNVRTLVEAHANVRLLCCRAGRLPFGDRHFELILGAVSGSHPEAEREVARVLCTDGTVYLESGWRAGPTQREAQPDSLPLRLTPLRGEARTAVQSSDTRSAEFLARAGLLACSFRRRPLRAAAERLGRRSWVRALGRREACMRGAAALQLREGPPGYVRRLAARIGLDLKGWRVALSDPGGYGSRKVRLFLFEPAAQMPSILVKLTRERRFNARLENEHRALERIVDLGCVEAESIPRPLFFGHHAGLALLGESVVSGDGLRSRLDVAPAAVDWIVELGSRTARSDPGTGVACAAALRQLQQRFVEVYRPTPEVARALEAAIDRIGQAGGGIPSVFQHGDLGIWNMLARPDGGVGVLDWEAADPCGLPLWDLFYFLRSFCVSASRGRDRLRKLQRHFVAGDAHTGFVVAATRRYCTALGIPSELIAPLFHTCWMHRALKESNRLAPERLARGHYFGLLQLGLAHPKAAIWS